MARCPFCGPHPIKTREELEKSLVGTFAKQRFMESVCDRCFAAICESIQGPGFTVIIADPRPINEAEQLDGVR